jgi:hypothetical protein
MHHREREVLEPGIRALRFNKVTYTTGERPPSTLIAQPVT